METQTKTAGKTAQVLATCKKTAQINLDICNCFVHNCKNMVKVFDHNSKTATCEKHENLWFSEFCKPQLEAN